VRHIIGKEPHVKSTATILSTAAALLLLFSCANSTGSGSSDPDSGDDPNSLAAYAGTWAMSYTETTSEESYEYSATFELKADGSYVSETVLKTTPAGGSPTYGYSDEKGTISLDGDFLTCKVRSKRESLWPFGDDSTGWTAVSRTYGQIVLASDGKFYVDVLKAQGSTSGIEGSWASESYKSTNSKPYKKVVCAFGSGELDEKHYTSETSSYSSTPSSSYHAVYSLNGGTIAITYDSKDPETQYYAIRGPYLIFGGQNSLDERAFIKQ
jgi:hypothetical protein